jgi:exportin-1
MIKNRWLVILPEERQGFRNYLIQVCSYYSTIDNIGYMFNQATISLVTILFAEWPSEEFDLLEHLYNLAVNDPNFQLLYLNVILFFFQNFQDSPETGLTSFRENQISKKLFEIAVREFIFIRQLIFQNSTENVIITSLKAIKYFSKLVDLQLILEEDFLNSIISQVNLHPVFLVPSLELLLHIFSPRSLPLELNKAIPSLFNEIVSLIQRLDPQYLTEWDITLLINTLTVFQSKNFSIFNFSFEQVLQAIQIVIEMTKSDYSLVFDACIDYWHNFVTTMMRIDQDSKVIEEVPNILSALRRLLIKRMVEPEDYELIDEDGNSKTYVETIPGLYKRMKTILIILARNDYSDTIKAIEELNQFLLENFSIDLMNSICWSIGAISGAFNQETEKNFLSTFINFLTNLDYEKVGFQDKTEITMAVVEVIS